MLVIHCTLRTTPQGTESKQSRQTIFCVPVLQGNIIYSLYFPSKKIPGKFKKLFSELESLTVSFLPCLHLFCRSADISFLLTAFPTPQHKVGCCIPCQTQTVQTQDNKKGQRKIYASTELVVAVIRDRLCMMSAVHF